FLSLSLLRGRDTGRTQCECLDGTKTSLHNHRLSKQAATLPGVPGLPFSLYHEHSMISNRERRSIKQLGVIIDTTPQEPAFYLHFLGYYSVQVNFQNLAIWHR